MKYMPRERIDTAPTTAANKAAPRIATSAVVNKIGGRRLRRHDREQIGRETIKRRVTDAGQTCRTDDKTERDRESRLDRDGRRQLDLVARPARTECQIIASTEDQQQACVENLKARFHVPVLRTSPCGRTISTAIIAA